MAQVVLKNVSKTFENGFIAVKDLSLHINNGEFMVLVGPSGCGKSTTLNMIAGLEGLSSGSIIIDKKDVADFSPKDRNIAMVFQDYALYPHMTVFENMAFSLSLQKVNKIEIKNRVTSVAATLEIEDILNSKPKNISGGQRQRVALGRAIVRDPSVFLFDEPLSNLDAKLRLQMRVELAKIHNKLKATMLFVTHDQTEAMTLGDRICILNKGVVQQIDTPKNIYNNPSNLFVAQFIGSPSTNIIPVSLQKNGDIVDIYKNNALLFSCKPEHLKRNLNSDAYLGIRPEQMEFCNEKNAHFNGRVTVVEHLGNENIVYIKTKAEEFVLRTSPQVDILPGEITHFRCINENFHLFDKETELNLNACIS